MAVTHQGCHNPISILRVLTFLASFLTSRLIQTGLHQLNSVILEYCPSPHPLLPQYYTVRYRRLAANRGGKWGWSEQRDPIRRSCEIWQIWLAKNTKQILFTLSENRVRPDWHVTQTLYQNILFSGRPLSGFPCFKSFGISSCMCGAHCWRRRNVSRNISYFSRLI